MTDESRPAPQYGEYATPEEVARLRGIPLAAEPIAAPATASVVHRTDHAAAAPATSATLAAPARPRRLWDAPLTVGMLVLGFFWTVSSFSGYLDFSSTLNQALAPTDFELRFGADADTAGIVLLVIHSVLLLAAVGVAVSLIRRRRLAFWVPLVAGLTAFAADIVVLGILIANNPVYTSMLLDRP